MDKREATRKVKKVLKDSQNDLKKADRDFKRAVQIWQSQKLPCGHIFVFESAILNRTDKLVRSYGFTCKNCFKSFEVQVNNSNLITKTIKLC
jgi:hypothetical protein